MKSRRREEPDKALQLEELSQQDLQEINEGLNEMVMRILVFQAIPKNFNQVVNPWDEQKPNIGL
jgi:hypothetical protein